MACPVAEVVCNPSTNEGGRASLRRLSLDVASSTVGRAKSHGRNGSIAAAR